jgi:hypothetical protein
VPLVQFETVDQWTSFTNQGADVAAWDLSGDGTPDLVVLRVDAPAGGPNQAFYSVGSRLIDGKVQTWHAWTPIPDWDSNQDEGAGLAVVDFGADGLALVVLQVRGRNNLAPNQARLRVGRRLDANGVVRGGWTDWQDVPGWNSFRNQDAAVAVADLNGDGTPDLVVLQIDDFHTDHPDLPNRALYRIARGLDKNGGVQQWGEWKQVDWHSWFNQGAGVAVADLDGDGVAELIVFQIDNPDGQNSGEYRVGWRLDGAGEVTGGWGPWTAIDGWGSWDDQGGGLALLPPPAGERPRAVVLHVDNGDGVNEGRYGVFDLVLDIDQAAELGIWRLLPYYSEVLPVHAGLMHTGQVLFFAGSGNNVFRRTAPDFGNRGVETSVLWDPAANSFTHPNTLRRPDGKVVDYFCCGHCMLPDGRLLVAGGTDQYDKIIVNGAMQAANHGFSGIRDAMLFDPVATTWSAIAAMAQGRWYPTLVMLENGHAVAVSGLIAGDKFNEEIEEIANPDTDGWTPAREFWLPLYPHLFLLADGRLIYTGGKMDTDGPSAPLIFDAAQPTQAAQIANLPEPEKCNQSASVILPPAQDQKFMLLGGGPQDDDGKPREPATTRTAIVDTSKAGALKYEPAAALEYERMHVNAVLLPDSTVLATGGAVYREATPEGKVDPNQFSEIFEAEIYDPGTNAWTPTASATVARLYHSVALLLPDGRVVTAGGNPDKGRNVTWLPPLDPHEEMRLEIFSPPYLFKSANPRPKITAVQPEITYGKSFVITTPAAQGTLTACLIRPGLTTHSFNGEQRLVKLTAQQRPPDGLTASVDVGPRVAPPGWYMLFLVNDEGVPSEAAWVHLT